MGLLTSIRDALNNKEKADMERDKLELAKIKKEREMLKDKLKLAEDLKQEQETLEKEKKKFRELKQVDPFKWLR